MSTPIKIDEATANAWLLKVYISNPDNYSAKKWATRYGILLSSESCKTTRIFFAVVAWFETLGKTTAKDSAFAILEPFLATQKIPNDRFTALNQDLLLNRLTPQDKSSLSNTPIVYTSRETKQVTVCVEPHIQVAMYIEAIQEKDGHEVFKLRGITHPLIRDAGDNFVKWKRNGNPSHTLFEDSSAAPASVVQSLVDQLDAMSRLMEVYRKETVTTAKDVSEKLNDARKDVSEKLNEARKDATATNKDLTKTFQHTLDVVAGNKFALSRPDGSPLRKNNRKNKQLKANLEKANKEIEELYQRLGELMEAYEHDQTFLAYMKKELATIKEYLKSQDELHAEKVDQLDFEQAILQEEMEQKDTEIEQKDTEIERLLDQVGAKQDRVVDLKGSLEKAHLRVNALVFELRAAFEIVYGEDDAAVAANMMADVAGTGVAPAASSDSDDEVSLVSV